MTSKFLRVFLACAVSLTISALAQTGSAATPASPAASSPAAAPAPNTGTKVGAINVEGAVFGSNEGQKELDTLQKKFEPKRNELKGQNDELEALKKQLTNTQEKLNEEALATLKKQIESKQKLFDRAVQDAQEDFGAQQQEIFGRILQKVAPVIVKYSQDNGYGLIIDTSKQWPQGRCFWRAIAWTSRSRWWIFTTRSRAWPRRQREPLSPLRSLLRELRSPLRRQRPNSKSRTPRVSEKFQQAA